MKNIKSQSNKYSSSPLNTINSIQGVNNINNSVNMNAQGMNSISSTSITNNTMNNASNNSKNANKNLNNNDYKLPPLRQIVRSNGMDKLYHYLNKVLVAHHMNDYPTRWPIQFQMVTNNFISIEENNGFGNNFCHIVYDNDIVIREDEFSEILFINFFNVFLGDLLMKKPFFSANQVCHYLEKYYMKQFEKNEKYLLLYIVLRPNLWNFSKSQITLYMLEEEHFITGHILEIRQTLLKQEEQYESLNDDKFTSLNNANGGSISASIGSSNNANTGQYSASSSSLITINSGMINEKISKVEMDSNNGYIVVKKTLEEQYVTLRKANLVYRVVETTPKMIINELTNDENSFYS